MLNYSLLILSAGLFSSGFLFNKLYQKNCGSGMTQTFCMAFFQAVITCISMFVIGGFKLLVTPFSVGIALIHAINSFILTLMGLKAFKYANLSVYSMFMMLGSIIIPSAFGIFFYNEEITLTKSLCFVMIFLSLYFSISKGESDKRGNKYCLAVFVGNGMAGVLSKIHQSNEALRVPTESFLLQSALVRLLICGVIIAVLSAKQKENLFSLKGVGFAMGGGFLNAVGNYFNLFVLISIPVTAHSIITTGMTLIFSALITVLSKEKLSRKNIISLTFALIASVLAVL